MDLAADPTIEDWQRRFAAGLAGGGEPKAAPEPGRASAPAIATTDGTWKELQIASKRTGHTAIYDPVRDRMIVFGGIKSPYLNDVWALTLSGIPAWSQITPSGTPPSARAYHSAIYDPVRDRMVLFGGDEGFSTFRNDVWALTLSGAPAWSLVTPGGTPPSPRFHHQAVYDPVRDQMLVFGGWATGFQLVNDVWALAFSGSPAWSLITPAGTPPNARGGHSAIYDPVRDRLVIFGGENSSSGFMSDVWALTLSGGPAWSQITPGGTPPVARFYHSAIYDPLRDRMMVFGGASSPTPYLDDLWALTLSGNPAWSQIAPGGTPPGVRFQHTAIYDAVRDRMVLFGGDVGANSYHNDVWALVLSGPVWARLGLGGTPPSPRAGHSAIYDPVRDRMVLFGGGDYSPAYFNEVWALTLSGIPGWSQITPSGTPPGARVYHTAIYDPVRDRMVIFGGASSPNPYLNDVWALSLSGAPTWSQITPSGTPPSARYRHTAIYDPARDRIVIFGGQDVSYFNDVWSLSLSGTPTWSHITPTGTSPSVRTGETATFDPVRDRMIVFGGTQSPPYLNDVWVLTFSGTPSWSQITPSGTPPNVRALHTAVYDPGRDRVVVFAGDGGFASNRNDAWALSLSGSPAWSQLNPSGTLPSARATHAAVYDPARDRMVVFGGAATAPSLLNDVWWLGWTAAVGVETRIAAPDHVTLGTPWPNPFTRNVTLDFEVARAARVRLDVYDLHGRRVRTVEDALLPPGRYSRPWDGSGADGAPLPAGVYFARLGSGGVARCQRVVLTR